MKLDFLQFALFLLSVKQGVQAQTTATTIIKDEEIGKPVPPTDTVGTTTHDIMVPVNNVCSGGQIVDLNVNVMILHTYIGDLDISITSPTGTKALLFGDSTGNSCSVPCGSQDDIDVVFDDEGAIDLAAGCPSPLVGSIMPFDQDGGTMSSLAAFDGEDPEGLWTLEIVDENSGDIGTLEEFGLEIMCNPPDPNRCGPTIGLLLSSCSEFTLQCCDRSTGAAGPACCGTTPYDPLLNSCCGDGTLVTGTSDSECAPSGAPSSAPSQVPSSKPSSFPSAEPTPLTCDLGPVCDYEFEEDESGGIIAAETYYAVCTDHDGHYHQECYPDSLVGSLGPDDVIPGGKGSAGRAIVSCGCCPETTLEVKGSTPACEGGLDCFAEGAEFSVKRSKKSTSLKSVAFEICIDGTMEMKENFYEPSADEEVECGNCGTTIV